MIKATDVDPMSERMWTLGQALAWACTYDLALVATYSAQVDDHGTMTVEHVVPSQDAQSAAGIAINVEENKNPPTLLNLTLRLACSGRVDELDVAKKTLMQALAEGKFKGALGVHNGEGGRKQISVVDATALSIADHQQDWMGIALRPNGRFETGWWVDVRIPRQELLQVWPLTVATDEKAPDKVTSRAEDDGMQGFVKEYIEQSPNPSQDECVRKWAEIGGRFRDTLRDLYKAEAAVSGISVRPGRPRTR